MNSSVLTYVHRALSGTPSVVATMVSEIDASDPIWDLRPDPDRFTLREVIAHLADWETIWLERVSRILHEETPTLPDVDEGDIAVLHGYAAQDPVENLSRIIEGRSELIELLGSVPEASWSRTGNRPPLIGILTLDELAAMILGHDGYHTGQIADWLSAARNTESMYLDSSGV